MSSSHPQSLAPRARLRALLVGVCAVATPWIASGQIGSAAKSAGAVVADTALPPRLAPRHAPQFALEVNRGQADARAKYVGRASGVGLFFTEHGVELALSKRMPRSHRSPDGQFTPDAQGPQAAVGLLYHFAHSNAHPRIEALDPLPGRANYFVGSDPRRWHTDVARYQRVRYHDVYPGINIVYYGNDGQLEFDIEAAPGADLARVRLQIDGTDSVTLDDDGNLQLHTALGELTQSKPVVYQMIGGERREVRGDYVLRDIHGAKPAHEIAFRVNDFDRRYALVLDPTLVYSTLIGGTGTDDGTGVAVDSSGNSYLTGSTNSPVFPTTVGSYQTTPAGNDVFVTKVSPDGTTLLYSALFGGGAADFANGIGVDGAGQAYVTGQTVSSDFPTMNALQPTIPGPQSGFVAALNASGSGLVYSTYLGGTSGNAAGEAIAVDAAGNAYVTGLINGPGLPVSGGAFQASNGGGQDAFAFKFDATGARVYGTYLGGAGSDEGRAIAFDAEGNAYIAGGTASATFNGVALSTIGPLGGTLAMLIAKVNPAGSGLVYATKIGGSQLDEAIGIAVDSGHQVYFAAFSNSPDLPPTVPPQHTGTNEAYIGHLDDSGTTLYDFTWYGATDGSQDYGAGLDLDESRQSLYVVGYANPLSTGFPALNPVAALDCANQAGATPCNVATGAFLLQYTLNPLTLASATRVAGDSAPSHATFAAVAHDPVGGHVATAGSTDGNPPSALATNAGGDDILNIVTDFAQTQTPVVGKYFEPATAINGKEVTFTIQVNNPTQSTLASFDVTDNLPSCLRLVGPQNISFTPPACAAVSFPNDTSNTSPVYSAVELKSSSGLNAGNSCFATFQAQAFGADPCANQVSSLSSYSIGSTPGSFPPSTSNLRLVSEPAPSWKGPGATLSNNLNWNGAAPLDGNDAIFPAGVTPTTLTNNLPPAQTFNLITFTGTGYSLGGAAFNIVGGVNNSGANTFTAGVNAIAPAVFNNAAGATLTLSSGISANGAQIDFNGDGGVMIPGAMTASAPTVLNFSDRGFAALSGTISPNFDIHANARVSLFLNANGAASFPVTLDFSVLQGRGSLGVLTVNSRATVEPDTATGPNQPSVTPAILSPSTFTLNGGTVLILFTPTNAGYSNLATTGPVTLNGGTLMLNFGTTPSVGSIFSNLISAPSAISGCFTRTIANPSNVFVTAHCSGTSVSAIVDATDGIFRDGFGK